MESAPPKLCPRCGEPRILAPECPRCGVLYAKARAPALPAPVQAEVPVPPEEPLWSAPSYAPVLPPSAEPLAWEGDLEDARHELRLRQFALPLALGGAWLLVKSPMWGGLIRVFLSMWIHELGHAVTSWFCGFPAIPGPWRTVTFEERSAVLMLLLTAGLAGLVLRGHFTQRRWLMAAGAVGLVLQFVGTVLLSPSQSRQLITFGGDGGCLVLGALLLTTLYAPRESALRQGWLHWGYMVIGAAAFMDAFSQWWSARRDFERIPFGDIEGVGLSDPSKLVEVHGWSETDLVRRYTGLGLVCLALLGVLYAVGWVRARAALRALEGHPGGGAAP